jgi:erythromycin esterase
MGKRQKLLCSAGVAVGCVVLALAPAAPSRSADNDAAIRAAYKTMERALLAKNAAQLSQILAPGFYQCLLDGTIESRDAYIRDETDADPGVTLSSLTYQPLKITVRGNEADAEVTHTYVGTYAVNGIPKPFNGTVHLAEQWTVGSDGTWKLVLSTLQDAVSYVDGKRIVNQRQQAPPTSALIAELQAHALVIPTLAFDADSAQLAKVGAAVGDSHIVGMGEGSHGTSQFFAFKDRLFKYLVESKGFTVFAMEAYWGAGLYVDRYIKTGRGTAEQAVASLAFWTWDTPQVVDLVRWMREYNAKPGNHPILSFVGIDMQSAMGAIGYLATYFSLHDSAHAAGVNEALNCVAAAAAYFRAKPDAGCREKVVAVGNRLGALKNVPDLGVAQHSVAIILQYLDWKNTPEEDQLGARDRAMAENLKWLVAFHPDAKIAVWAHNYHIGTSAKELPSRPMGSYLRAAFGRGYYAIGQTFGSGTVRAIVSPHGLQAVTVPLSPGDTIAAAFRWLNGTAAFIDLRGLAATGALQAFFSTDRSIEEIGATIDPLHPAYVVPMIVPNMFDGLVYIPVSTAATDGSRYSEMQREIRTKGGSVWEVSGLGFNDVTAEPSTDSATLANSDALNSSTNQLLRRFDAAGYAGVTVRVTGETRAKGLLGFVYPFSQAVAPSGSVASSSQGKATSGAGDNTWQKFAINLNVPRNARFVDVGFWAEGLGSVEVRKLKVTRTSS